KESQKNIKSNETKPTKSRMKPTENDVTNPIKCNGHRQSSKGNTELNAIKPPKCLIRTSKL
ncbi:27868_t:CDS:1, partial [Gigaspora margarita]